MEHTRISVDDRPIVVTTEDEKGNLVEEEKLGVTGWIAFSQHPYRDEEMAGIRIYTRGKLATVTRDFGIKSGFTGENTIRSYLVGEIQAEWIDPEEGEDLNRTACMHIFHTTMALHMSSESSQHGEVKPLTTLVFGHHLLQ